MQGVSELDFTRARNAVDRHGAAYRGVLLGRMLEFPAMEGVGFHRIDDATFLYTIDATPRQPSHVALDRRDLICIRFITEGCYRLTAGHEREAVRSGMIQIGNHPSPVLEFSAGTRIKGLILVMDRARFMDRFSPSLSNLPYDCRPIFTSSQGMDVTVKMPLPAASFFDVDRVLQCGYAEPLRSLSTNAVMIDLVCQAVAALNEFGRGGGSIAARVDRKLKAIEAAAKIYRSELREPPTLAEIADRVGLNRNSLTLGFREAFGRTPHEYQRQFRMTEAERLLGAGKLSISEVGRRVGYSGYASFAKAYQDYFGQPPSSG